MGSLPASKIQDKKMKFTKAITRVPGSNYQDGLTTVDLGVPDFNKTVLEHAGYIQTLKECGLRLDELTADLHFPDSTFVEDTAVLLSSTSLGGPAAILSRPGASSRAGEVTAIKPVLQKYFKELAEIAAPGTLDGGDICEADDKFIIGRIFLLHDAFQGGYIIVMNGISRIVIKHAAI